MKWKSKLRNIIQNNLKEYLTENTDQINNIDISKKKIPEYIDNRIYDFIEKVSNSKTTVKQINWFNIKKIFVIIPSAAILLIFLLAGFILFKTNNKNSYFTANFLSGDVKITNNKKINDYKSIKVIRNKSIINTGSNSECLIQLNDISTINIKENSEIVFNKISKRNSVINLKKGKIFVNVNPNRNTGTFQINIKPYIVQVIGTEFFIEKRNNIIIGVKRGKVKLINMDNNKSHIISQDDIVTIENNNVIKEKNSDVILNQFDNSTLEYINKHSNSQLILEVDKGGKAKLNIDNNINRVFYNKIRINLEPGEHNILVKKGGFKSYSEKIILVKNKKMIKRIKLIPDNQNMKIENNEEIDKKYNWTSKKIYQIDKDNIISFSFYNKNIIAVTKTSIYNLDQNGKLSWKSHFGSEKGMFFMSSAVIRNNKLYISSLNRKILVHDLSQNKEITTINSNGSITFGYSPVITKNKIIFPLTDGIYIYDLNTNVFNENQLIDFYSAVTPLVKNNKIYLASYINKNLSCYDLDGNLDWDLLLDNKTYNMPRMINNVIYLIDESGILYSVSNKGELIKKQKVLPGLISQFTVRSGNIYALADNGILYKINMKTFSVSKLFIVDKNPDKSKYLNVSPVIYDGYLFIGNSEGQIIIHNIKENTQKILKASDAEISTRIYYNNKTNGYYFGTKSGEIITLKEK